MVVTISGQRTQMDARDWRRYRGYALWIDSGGYVQISIGGRHERIHRFIVGAKPGEITDHRNRDKLDNRKRNLRIATRSGNGSNSKHRTHNTTGYRGVSRDTWTGRYRATIRHNSRTIHGPRFNCPIEAARWFDAKARELHGEFAVLNFTEQGGCGD